MAHEFKIKNALLVEGSSNTFPIVAIRNSQDEIKSDSSTLLVTAKAIYDFHMAGMNDVSLALSNKQDILTFGSKYSIPYSDGSSNFEYDSSLYRSINWGNSNITKIDGFIIDYSNTGGLIRLKNDSSIFLQSSKLSEFTSISSPGSLSYIDLYSTNINYKGNAHSFSLLGNSPSHYFEIRDSSYNNKPYTFVVVSSDPTSVRYLSVKPDGTVYCSSIGESIQTKTLYYNVATGRITYGDPCTGTPIAWGNISGNINSQTDLWNILTDLSTNKFNKSGGTISGNVTIHDGSLILDNGNVGINGDLAVSGNIVVDGSVIVIGVETIEVSSNFIYLNKGLKGTPPSWMQSGIVVERGSSNPYAFVFDETSDTFRIGIVSSPDASGVFNDSETQAVATRQDSPISGGISYWNDTLFRLDTSIHLRYSNGNLLVNNDISIGNRIFSLNLSNSGQRYLVFWNSTTGELTRGDASYLGFDTSTFLSLRDTPNSYSDVSAGSVVVINDAGNGLEFAPRIWRENNNEVTLDNENANVLFYQYIELEADAGIATLVDKNVTSSSAKGAEESYTFNLDGVVIAKIYGESNGSGGIQNEKFLVPRTFLSESSVYFSGIPNVSTGYILFYNPTSKEVTYGEASIGGGGVGDIYWSLDGSTLIPINTSNEIKLDSIKIKDDAGAVNFINMNVTSSPASGTEESYSFNIDGSTIVKVWGESSGTGVLRNTGFVVKTYQYMGDPNTNGSWRFYVNSSGDLVFEKRISGTWVEKGKFTQ